MLSLSLSLSLSIDRSIHYENTPIQIHWKFYHPKMAIFQIKNSDIFHISAQNIDCGYSLEPPCRGGSNEYQQSMFLSRNNKNNVYPCKPQFYCIKVGLKGVKIICFRGVYISLPTGSGPIKYRPLYLWWGDINRVPSGPHQARMVSSNICKTC